MFGIWGLGFIWSLELGIWSFALPLTTDSRPRMMNDLRYAFRQLLKNPGFTAIAVLSLALGIGASTIVFSWIRSVLLDAVPGARQADRPLTTDTRPRPLTTDK